MMTKFTDVSNGTKEEIKKTVFTHRSTDNKGWFVTKDTPYDEDVLEVKYLGNCLMDGDLFACYDNEGLIIIYKGTKGSEFD